MNMNQTEIMNIATMQTDEIEEYIFGFKFGVFDNDWKRNKIIRESQSYIKDPHEKNLAQKLKWMLTQSTLPIDRVKGRGLFNDINFELRQIRKRQLKIDDFLLELRGRLSRYWQRVREIDTQLPHLQANDAALLDALVREKEQLTKALKNTEELCQKIEDKSKDLEEGQEFLIQALDGIKAATGIDW